MCISIFIFYITSSFFTIVSKFLYPGTKCILLLAQSRDPIGIPGSGLPASEHHLPIVLLEPYWSPIGALLVFCRWIMAHCSVATCGHSCRGPTAVHSLSQVVSTSVVVTSVPGAGKEASANFPAEKCSLHLRRCARRHHELLLQNFL